MKFPVLRYPLFLILLVCFVRPVCAELSNSAFTWRLSYTRNSPGGVVEDYRLYFQGFPVYGVNEKVFHTSSGSVRIKGAELNPQLYRVGDFTSEFPVLTAFQKLVQAENMDSSICSWEKVWFPRQEVLLPAFQVNTCPTGVSGNREFILQAETGEILEYHSRLAFAPQDTVIRATIFHPDPLTKSGQFYGGSYTDQNDADVPELNAQRDTVSLQVVFENDTFYLKGKYVELKDIEFPFDPPVRQQNPEFYFTRNQQGFEDVNVYYHIHRYQEYIRSLGFTDLCNFPLWVDPHGVNGGDNSYFSPGALPQEGFLSFGEGGVDDGEDADVIVHEYGHALSDAAAPGSNLGTERRGLDEGICDYFAAGMSYDHTLFRWNELYTWDGHNEYWAGRDAHQNLVYPISGSNIYTIGSLWAAVMMDIRMDLGPTVADKLQLQALYLNTQNNNLPRAARNILLADSALFSGIHTTTLLYRFCTRNIITGNECAGISRDPDADISVLRIYPNPAETYVEFSEEPGLWQLYNSEGRMLQSGTSRSIDLERVPAGIYLIRCGAKTYRIIRD